MQEFATLAKATIAKLGKVVAPLSRCRQVFPGGQHGRARPRRALRRRALGNSPQQKIRIVLHRLPQADQVALVRRERTLPDAANESTPVSLSLSLSLALSVSLLSP